MESITFELVGDVVVGVTITQLDNGSLQFDLAVDESTGTIGDLNALYFDLADDSLLDGLSVSGTDVTGTAMKADGVTKIDNFTNINGDVVKDLGKFDLGVQFGTQGIAKDDIQSTSFVLSHDSTDLTLDLFTGMDSAVRLTSVGSVDGSRDGSVKIGGVADPIDLGPVHVANDDTMTVSNEETFSPFGIPDPLDNLVFSLLENDTTDGTAYTGAVTGVNGSALTDGLIVSGSNGGLLQVNGDGSLDFSANDAFDFLTAGETTTTAFEYEIEGGSTATLTVTVFGFDSTGGGGQTGGNEGDSGPGDTGDDTPPPPILDDPFLL